MYTSYLSLCGESSHFFNIFIYFLQRKKDGLHRPFPCNSDYTLARNIRELQF
nr:MAG TPA: hypothetical protein [Caudoviricetes sp.]